MKPVHRLKSVQKKIQNKPYLAGEKNKIKPIELI